MGISNVEKSIIDLEIDNLINNLKEAEIKKDRNGYVLDYNHIERTKLFISNQFYKRTLTLEYYLNGLLYSDYSIKFTVNPFSNIIYYLKILRIELIIENRMRLNNKLKRQQEEKEHLKKQLGNIPERIRTALNMKNI